MACSNSRLDECNNVRVGDGFNGQQVTLQEPAISVLVLPSGGVGHLGGRLAQDLSTMGHIGCFLVLGLP